MSITARIYVYAVSFIGSTLLVENLLRWESQDIVRFFCYLMLAVASSRLKVALPGITGTMSVLFFSMLFSIVQLSLPESLLIGCVAAFCQCLWSQQEIKAYQLAFNTGSMAMAIAATSLTYHSSLLHRTHVDTAIMLVAASVVFFLMNTFPVSAAISLTEHRSLKSVWQECYFWSFPYYLLGAAVAGGTSAATKYIGWQTAMLVLPVVYLIYRSYYLYLGRMEDEKKHAEEMASLHLRTIEALALAIEAKDHSTHDHLQRVQVYAMEIGKELCLSETELEALRAAAVLHDIGKLAVPEHIISKPGKLTREEFEKMKIHPV